MVPMNDITGNANYFEDFEVGAKMKHDRGTTVGEVESQLLTKLVMNTADMHFNEDRAQDSPYGQRLVFGLVTGTICIGLTTQDTAENALAEIGLDKMRFTAPVFLGDTLYAYSEVIGKNDGEREDSGIVEFRHWGVKQDNTIVFECERRVLIKRRSHWGSK